MSGRMYSILVKMSCKDEVKFKYNGNSYLLTQNHYHPDRTGFMSVSLENGDVSMNLKTIQHVSIVFVNSRHRTAMMLPSVVMEDDISDVEVCPYQFIQ